MWREMPADFAIRTTTVLAATAAGELGGRRRQLRAELASRGRGRPDGLLDHDRAVMCFGDNGHDPFFPPRCRSPASGHTGHPLGRVERLSCFPRVPQVDADDRLRVFGEPEVLPHQTGYVEIIGRYFGEEAPDRRLIQRRWNSIGPHHAMHAAPFGSILVLANLAMMALAGAGLLTFQRLFAPLPGTCDLGQMRKDARSLPVTAARRRPRHLHPASRRILGRWHRFPCRSG